MNYNYIGIDPSITSTGMVVNGEMFSYSYENAGYTKKGNLSKWYSLSEHVINFRFHNQVIFTDYQEEQIVKIELYRTVIEKIIKDIKDTIDVNIPIKVCIEGYSYGSNAGNLIDLVTFGTLLRDRLIDIGCDIKIMSPKTLKLESCKMTYPPIKTEVGKRVKKIKIEFKNNDGINGGDFDKTHMYKSIIENDKWNDKWKNHLKSIESDISKKIPKPHEDLNDAYLLYQYVKCSI